jgi:hypothetical protein
MRTIRWKSVTSRGSLGRGVWRWTGMKSMSAPEPVLVVKLVSRILVFGRYWRLDSPILTGASFKKPPLSESKIRLNNAAESNLGMQHQSMEPSIPTKAEPCISPISPYSCIGL